MWIDHDIENERLRERYRTRRKVVIAILAVVVLAGGSLWFVNYLQNRSQGFPRTCGWLCEHRVKQEFTPADKRTTLVVSICDHGAAGYGYVWVFDHSPVVGYQQIWRSPHKALADSKTLHIHWLDNHTFEMTYISPNEGGEQTVWVSVP